MLEKMGKNKVVKKLQTYQGIVFIFVVICLLTSGFSFQYYKNLRDTVRAESKTYLQEVSRRIAANINRIVEDNFSMLFTIGASLENTQNQKMQDVEILLNKQQKYWNYENILLVDKSGHAYTVNDSRSTFLSFDDSIRASMLNKQKGLATTQIVNNKEFIIFTVPLENVNIDGKEMIALAASYDPISFDEVLSMTAFNDQAYSQIITKSGTVVTRPSSKYAINNSYNIFSVLEKAQMDQGSDLNVIREQINNDLSDQISFSLDGVHRYMVYTPISLEDWCLLTFVPFQVVNEKSDMLMRTTLIICGMLTLIFCILITVLFYSFSSNRKRLESIAYVDKVTSGNTIQRFYELAEINLSSKEKHQYALVYTNFENFKVLNAQLGRQNCDSILYHFNLYATSSLHEEECMGHLSADNFYLLLKYTDEIAFIKRLELWASGAERYIQDIGVTWSMPVTEFGIYVIENATLPLTEMMDRAKLALKESFQTVNRKLHYAFYDDNARRQLFREKQLADMMESALENREFQLYLQPKYHLPEEHIRGAEALVRWESIVEGMIYPNEFIPLFEKNGFIVQLDLWMFEEVCRTIRSWIDQGLTPVKVSVNCSRIHFKNPKFLTPYLKIVSEYEIDKSLLEIELTESVVFEDTKRLTKIIHEIRSAGFGCSMDDFGSGYSSLNLIQSIPVDTLKIDKIFFRRNICEPNRTEAVVGSIVQMAQSLSMVIVAEGVEYGDQVEMLKRVGCDYIQGFVFAKPMNVSSFEELAFKV